MPFVTVLLLGSDSFVVSCACGPMSLQVVAHAGLSGLARGAMALAGLALGGAASRLTSTSSQRWAAVGLLAASCVLFLM